MSAMRAPVIAAAAFVLVVLLSYPAFAQSYRIKVKRVDGNVYQALSSKVIIETRICGDLELADVPEEAILNWEGRYGNNWLLFTTSKIRCDVVAIG
jgi:hypothetical protein